ncbi:hypothetical protein PTT_18028 [Pyrenophora teres f. teres 0-1]|uniref:Uncharacterized protein n=1 Tax=Pyrenophora teres f. teres (strain 0-1) TaxID=861557 RepID=E3S5T0_PYRTT|nr:hypothetical protein PTT_18028 [Pyrenophora teres f. teres 0-1]
MQSVLIIKIQHSPSAAKAIDTLPLIRPLPTPPPLLASFFTPTRQRGKQSSAADLPPL